MLTHVNFSGSGSVYSQIVSLNLHIEHTGLTASHLTFRIRHDWQAVFRRLVVRASPFLLASVLRRLGDGSLAVLLALSSSLPVLDTASGEPESRDGLMLTIAVEHSSPLNGLSGIREPSCSQTSSGTRKADSCHHGGRPIRSLGVAMRPGIALLSRSWLHPSSLTGAEA